MYWLLTPQQQAEVRTRVGALVLELSTITDNPQNDQLFPFVGRKDRRKASAIISYLTDDGDTVADYFSGSGVIAYAAAELGRTFIANEWEPYAWRLSSAPWRLPEEADLEAAWEVLESAVRTRQDELYWTKCACGHGHVLESLFYDRDPVRFVGVTPHERLGSGGRTIVYRGKYRCPRCGATEKHFDAGDAAHVRWLESQPVPEIFSTTLIENSRINLSRDFTTYGNLFPARSKLALANLWEGIKNLKCSEAVRWFLEDVFLSILPRAKYKDYRSKSQDLHVPDRQLRESNVFYAFGEQLRKRWEGLQQYDFKVTTPAHVGQSPILCQDFRSALAGATPGKSALVITDPPWTDGTAYFERAQLYHPWIGYSLSLDSVRLDKEMVVSDAPSRRGTHDLERWWRDLEEFFVLAHQSLRTMGFLAMYFRPIPAKMWLANLNRLKLVARKSGFEPLLSIDVESSDPSMRIQQSASYVFSKDIVLLFLKLDNEIRRDYEGDLDLDQVSYQAAVEAQEAKSGPFSFAEWRQAVSSLLVAAGAPLLDSPRHEPRFVKLFHRYMDATPSGSYLPKIETPFSGQLFDTPAIERLFAYVPSIIDDLTRNSRTFTYDEFLLGIAEYVENGTRSLISEIQAMDIRAVIEQYAEPIDGGARFQRRPLPRLPEGISTVLEMDPYDFEVFIAKLLEAQGFTNVTIVGRAGDRGVDVSAIDPDGRQTVVQCKRYIRTNVGSAPIQRLHSFAMTRGATRRIVVTTSGFTQQGKEEASLTDTELIDGNELETLIATYLPGSFES